MWQVEAREFVAPEAPNYLDLEDPTSLIRLDEPVTALGALQGLVVIDEIQRRPDLFPVLRGLADRQPLPARFLILGSGTPPLLRQASESLAGRIETISKPTPLMRIAIEDLNLAQIAVVYPGERRYAIIMARPRRIF